MRSAAVTRWLFLSLVALAVVLPPGAVRAEPATSRPEPPLLVVLDPLAKELACACVKGYGQRDYRKLAARLKTAMNQEIAIEFSDDLAESLAEGNPQREIIVIGERAVVAQGAEKAGLKCRPVCELTGLDGSTKLAGSFVARRDDPAKSLRDIAGRKVFVGLGSGEEINKAALAALRDCGAEPPPATEKRGSYTDAALDLLDSVSSPPPVAVIPSYALPLLQGCGTVKPGDLKVIGTTQPVPFITVFVSEAIAPEKREKLLRALLAIKEDGNLLKQLESRDGFKPLEMRKTEATNRGAAGDWPDWRGASRNARVPRLPSKLAEPPTIVWKKAAMTGGLAGLSVGGGRLILAERDFAEEHDVYRCLDAGTGELIWRRQFPARGKLDYGQSPRATPVIHGDRAYLLGAFGGLRCVNVSNGEVIWEREMNREFKSPLPTWGMCSTPLILGELLIVNPGATNASLVALELADGRTRWATPGLPAAYAAFICGDFGGRRQIVGYDQYSLGGWDVKTGERLWKLVPPVEGDFNVPTPVAAGDGILVSTENNGTRLYQFDREGRIIKKPAAEFADLAPSTASVVVTNGRVFGAHAGLYCLDLRNGLKAVWYREEEDMGDHASLIADEERVLVVTLGGELILLDARADTCGVISRTRLFPEEVEVYSHPALVGTRLYARGGATVLCAELGAR